MAVPSIVRYSGIAADSESDSPVSLPPSNARARGERPTAAEAEATLARARETIYAAPGPAVAEVEALLAGWGEAGAEAPERARVRARALELLAIGQRLAGDYAAGLRASEEAGRICEALGDEAGVAKACILAGNVQWALGGFEPALRLFERGLALRRSLGDRRGEAGALGSIGVMLDELGRLEEARRCYAESLAISRELGDRMFEGRTLNNLGEVCLKLGDLQAAREHAAAALANFRERGERVEAVNARNNLGRVALAAGRDAEAKAWFEGALDEAEQVGAPRARADARVFLAQVRAREGGAFFSLSAAATELEAALVEARALEMRALEAEICRQLADVRERAGEPAEALRVFRAFHDVQRQVFTAEAERRLRQLQVERALDAARAEATAERAKAEAWERLNRELEDQRSQLEAAVRRLLRVDRERNELLGLAAHDIQNPLGVIVSLAEHALGEARAAGAGADAGTLQTIHGTACAALELVRQILDLKAIEGGQRTLLPMRLDAGAVLRTVATDYRGRAGEKGLTVRCATAEAGDRAATVTVDPLSLRQVLDNLVSNAVKYTPAGGTVTLGVTRVAEPGGARVVLSIADTGPGFSAEDRARMFEPFARLSAKPTGGEHSSGLGLHLVRRLVAEIGGELRFESGTGEGARFEVVLRATG